MFFSEPMLTGVVPFLHSVQLGGYKSVEHAPHVDVALAGFVVPGSWCSLRSGLLALLYGLIVCLRFPQQRTTCVSEWPLQQSGLHMPGNTDDVKLS